MFVNPTVEALNSTPLVSSATPGFAVPICQAPVPVCCTQPVVEPVPDAGPVIEPTRAFVPVPVEGDVIELSKSHCVIIVCANKLGIAKSNSANKPDFFFMLLV